MTIKLYGGNQYIPLKQWSFPAGERGVTVSSPELISKFHSFTIECNFKGSDDLIDIMLLANACRNVWANVSLRLRIPYFPYARQDRVSAVGDSFSLQVAAQIINSCNFYEVEVWDIHSDVLAGMLKPGVLLNKSQDFMLFTKVTQIVNGNNKTALISPDAGASKKLYKLASMLELPVIEAKKIRDPKSGRIVKSTIDLAELEGYNSLIVVDDICDGGATFMQLAEHIRTGYDEALHLVTTHGIYSKGKNILYEYYDNVTCVNDMST